MSADEGSIRLHALHAQTRLRRALIIKRVQPYLFHHIDSRPATELPPGASQAAMAGNCEPATTSCLTVSLNAKFRSGSCETDTQQTYTYIRLTFAVDSALNSHPGGQGLQFSHAPAKRLGHAASLGPFQEKGVP